MTIIFSYCALRSGLKATMVAAVWSFPTIAGDAPRNRLNAEHRKDDIGFWLVVDESEALTGRRQDRRGRLRGRKSGGRQIESLGVLTGKKLVEVWFGLSRLVRFSEEIYGWRVRGVDLAFM